MIIGQILDRRYRVLQVLSSGAFGRTYLAVDTRRPGHPQCVVKQLQPPNSTPQQLKTAQRLFKQEAITLEKLGRHNQIPQLLAYFQENQQFYLVEEFIPGNPLSAEIVPGKPLPEGQVLSLLQKLLEILIFVHGEGVIHRDVNPSNVIRRSSDGKLVLIDFGSVKEVSTKIVTSHGQMPWTIAAGTPAYMPIEQFQGNPQFNSDIYAVGMIGIQALTALPASELVKLQSKLDTQNSTGKNIWRDRVQVSPALADAIDKMVHSYYGKRYLSAQEALTDLIKIAGDADTQKTKQASPRTTQQHRRHTPQLVLATAVVVLGGLGFAAYKRLPQAMIAQYYVNQGASKQELENYNEAIADYNQAIAVNPNHAEAFYNRGKAHYQKGSRQTALSDFTSALALEPKYAQAYASRGKTRFELGDDKGAIADYNQAIALNPKLANAYLSRGSVRAELGDELGAIADYNQAIAINPQLPAAYLNRCLSHSNLGQQSQAIEDCTKAIALKPNYAFAYQNRGLARRRLEDFQGALEDYNVAIRINPKDADPYYNRGLARYDLGDNQGALEDFSQVIRLNPNHALVYYDRGLVRADLPDKQGAIEDFQKSAKLCLDEGKLRCYKDAQFQINQLKRVL